MENQTSLEIKNISKTFPGVKALDDINIKAHGGEIIGLIGVNGAGKSTLMNILGGIHKPSQGQILIDGNPVEINSPQDAEKYGIGFIHQEPVMFNYMTVAENISLSRLKGKVNYKEINVIAKEYLGKMNCDIKPTDKVGELPIGSRQMVEIARALSSGGKILLFDEPTASFTDKEKQKLFEVIRDLKKQGSCIFFISHFLDEVEELTDRTIVLRDGKVVITGNTKDITREEILRNMIGGEVAQVGNEQKRTFDKVTMKVENLTVGKLPDHVSFEIRRGEVLGIWGLMGSGRTETLRAIYGIDKVDEGAVYLDLDDGRGLQKISFKDISNYCGYVTEARHDDGCMLPWTLWENMAAPNLKAYKKKLFLDYNQQKEDSKEFAKKLNVKAPSVFTNMSALSGGNQQKVIMAKWLMKKPKVFLIDEPTRGVDVGAKAEIQRMIRELAREGTSCLVVSSEIEEISALSDRVIILNRGVIKGELSREEIEKHTLMSLCV
ncbi:sugar ABC transporter ATP-binding protein [Blautia schinkii]|nr:sugar ABC transporter ATP-binding protein [Blautia schinkii]